MLTQDGFYHIEFILCASDNCFVNFKFTCPQLIAADDIL
jgi:hypothetical protein